MRRFPLFLGLLWLGAVAPASACRMGDLYYVWVAFLSAGAGVSALTTTGLVWGLMGQGRPSCLGGLGAALAGTLAGASLGATAGDLTPGLVGGLGGAAVTSAVALFFVRDLEGRARRADQAVPAAGAEK